MARLQATSLSSIASVPSRRRSVVVVACATALLAAAATGCASDRSSPVVLRIGAVVIDRATVDHWARAITLGSTVAGMLERSSSTPRQKALDFLLSANWAIGAAAEHGLEVSDGAVERGVREKIEAAPGGPSEFEEEISATGQTLADVKLEVKTALVLSRLRELLSSRVPPVTQAQIADYYRQHLQSFRIPDQRLVDLIEEIHGFAHAVAVGRRLGPGVRFAKSAIRELVPRQTRYEDAHRENGRMVRAIFATPRGQIGGPVIYHSRWVIFVVRKLVPGGITPLSKTKAEISERLSEERHRRALASFLEAYRREWTAKTSCKPAFVVQKCSEYSGRLAPEGNLLAGN